jgi:hypothetical protein
VPLWAFVALAALFNILLSAVIYRLWAAVDHNTEQLTLLRVSLPERYVTRAEFIALDVYAHKSAHGADGVHGAALFLRQGQGAPMSGFPSARQIFDNPEVAAAILFCVSAIAGQLLHGVKQSLAGEARCIDWFRKDLRRTAAAMIGNAGGMLVFIATGVLGAVYQAPNGWWALLLFGFSNGFSADLRAEQGDARAVDRGRARRAHRRRRPMRETLEMRAQRRWLTRVILFALAAAALGLALAGAMTRCFATEGKPVMFDCAELAVNIAAIADFRDTGARLEPVVRLARERERAPQPRPSSRRSSARSAACGARAAGRRGGGRGLSALPRAARRHGARAVTPPPVITWADYMKGRDEAYAEELTLEIARNARRTIEVVNAVLAAMAADGVELAGVHVASGWRPRGGQRRARQNARPPHSKHLTAEACDLAICPTGACAAGRSPISASSGRPACARSSGRSGRPPGCTCRRSRRPRGTSSSSRSTSPSSRRSCGAAGRARDAEAHMMIASESSPRSPRSCCRRGRDGAKQLRAARPEAGGRLQARARLPGERQGRALLPGLCGRPHHAALRRRRRRSGEHDVDDGRGRQEEGRGRDEALPLHGDGQMRPRAARRSRTIRPARSRRPRRAASSTSRS